MAHLLRPDLTVMERAIVVGAGLAVGYGLPMGLLLLWLRRRRTRG